MKYNFLFMFFILCGCFNNKQDYTFYADQDIKVFAKELERTGKYRLVGSGGAMMEDVKKLNVTFFSDHIVNLSQARVLIIQNADEFLKIINSDSKLIPYLHEFPFKATNLKISISFFQSLNCLEESNLISLVLLMNGKIYYYIYDFERGDHVQVLEETYEEAVQKINENKTVR